MKKLTLFFVVVVTLSLSSCSVVKTETVKTLDIYGAGVVQTPVLVDLDVKYEKVTASATNSDIAIAKLDAVANAVEKANADILVEPTFKTETTNGKTTAVVTGFPATYKNFRTITENDIELLKAGVTQKAETYEPEKKKNKSALGAILGGVGAAVLAIVVALVL